MDALLLGCIPDALLPRGESDYCTRGDDPAKKEVHSLIKELTILCSSLAWLEASHLPRGDPLAERVTWPNWRAVSFLLTGSFSYS